MKFTKWTLLCALSGATLSASAGQNTLIHQHQEQVTAFRLMENGNIAFSMRYAPVACGGDSIFSFEFSAAEHAQWRDKLQRAKTTGDQIRIHYQLPAAHQAYCAVTQVD